MRDKGRRRKEERAREQVHVISKIQMHSLYLQVTESLAKFILHSPAYIIAWQVHFVCSASTTIILAPQHTLSNPFDFHFWVFNFWSLIPGHASGAERKEKRCAGRRQFACADRETCVYICICLCVRVCVYSTHIWVLSQQALGNVFATRLLNANHAEIVVPSPGKDGDGIVDQRSAH